MSSDTQGRTRNYYLFLGFHNILLGLFPFFLPVYLFQQGAALSDICFFIALTGFGFVVTLFIFDKYRTTSSFIPILFSFILEGLLLWSLVVGISPMFVALINGGYSCLYWTIQRVFFLAGGTTNDSGKRFGNFQIYVLVVLKIGIFCGSLLLEHTGIWAVSLVTFGLGGAGILLFYQKRKVLDFPIELQKQRALNLSEIFFFNDHYRSKNIFIVDGVFLYLESYFWVISLYFTVGESFVRLGGLIILLAVLLGIIFYRFKNSIDRLDIRKMFITAVILYMCSWVMRALLSEEIGLSLQFSLLLFIGFCTSFFRLALNKRFFDIARCTTNYKYLLVKSYYSQLFLGICYCLFGLLALRYNNPGDFLVWSYWLSGLFASVYFLYLPVQES